MRYWLVAMEDHAGAELSDVTDAIDRAGFKSGEDFTVIEAFHVQQLIPNVSTFCAEIEAE